MKELIINITPFILTQNLFIFENGKLINAESFQLKDIAKVVFSKDNVEKVVLCGNRNYVEKFKKELQEEEIKKYNQNKIIFEVKETANV